MPKTLQIQSKIWKGSVEVADPLTMPQVRLIENALDGQNEDRANLKEGDRFWKSLADERMLPAICACVTKWDLENFPETVTPDTFPASPRKDSNEIIAQIFRQIWKIYLGELEIPNE